MQFRSQGEYYMAARIFNTFDEWWRSEASGPKETEEFKYLYLEAWNAAIESVAAHSTSGNSAMVQCCDFNPSLACAFNFPNCKCGADPCMLEQHWHQ
jgi:hypothetical protein